jgi:hypothetical protein
MKFDVIMYSLVIVMIAVVGVAAYSMYINQIQIGYALGCIGLVLFLIGFLLSIFFEEEQKSKSMRSHRSN